MSIPMLTLRAVFVPNNDDDSGARMRIHQAIKYGAKWAHEFCREVTHILVTRDELDVKMVAKSLPANKIPVSGPSDTFEVVLLTMYGRKGLFFCDTSGCGRAGKPDIAATLAQTASACQAQKS